VEKINLYYFRWGEEKCREDPTIFCRMVIEQKDQLCLSYPIWIINDIRYYKEIEFFKKSFNDRVLLVRIEASNDIRQKRGWDFQNDIDESECQLDTNVQWSFVFSNNEEDKFNEQMNDLIKMINS
jgi:phosphomevalonate kinase